MRLMSSSLLLTASVALLSSTGVHAAECTQAQLASFGSVAYNAGVNTACSGLVMGTTPVAGANLCGNEQCVAALKKFTAGVPDCEVAGYSVKASYEAAFSICTGGTAGSAPTMMPTTTPTDTSTASSTEGETANTTTTNSTTTTTTQPPASVASSVKEADTPAPSKTSSGSKATHSVIVVASTVFAAGFWLLLA